MWLAVTLVSLSSLATVVASEESEQKFSFPNWKEQIETYIKQDSNWRHTVESILAQFALGNFPKDFTPSIFENPINKTLVLNQQKTTFRSMIYHRAISSVDEIMTFPLPPGVTVEAAHAVVKELRDQGFPAFWVKEHRHVLLSKIK